MDLDLERVTRRALADAEATGGRVMARVDKAKHEATDTGEDHHHVVEFQMNDILKGWAKMWFEGVGKVRFDKGTALNMPPNITHSFLAGSDDFETLEIFMATDIGTVVDEE